MRNIPELGDFTIPVMIFCGGVAFGIPLVMIATHVALWLYGDAPVEPGKGTSRTGKR